MTTSINHRASSSTTTTTTATTSARWQTMDQDCTSRAKQECDIFHERFCYQAMSWHNWRQTQRCSCKSLVVVGPFISQQENSCCLVHCRSWRAFKSDCGWSRSGIFQQPCLFRDVPRRGDHENGKVVTFLFSGSSSLWLPVMVDPRWTSFLHSGSSSGSSISLRLWRFRVVSKLSWFHWIWTSVR
jgi:hypothetical protein